jgi:predicted translin family RNA/ssDNA-binding protein
VAVFDNFKRAVKEIRMKIEKFKNDNPRLNKAISKIIDALPQPFNTFTGIIWDGLDKDDDASQKILDILQKIAKNDAESFGEIKKGIKDLLAQNATKDQILEVAEKIRKSKEEIVQILDTKLDEILKRVKGIDKKLEELLNEVKKFGVKNTMLSDIPLPRVGGTY